MSQIIKILLAFIVSWMFFFPLDFNFLPSAINSKMLMAVLGMVFIWRDQVKHQFGFIVDRSVIWIYTLAILFSLSCFASTVINNTYVKDYTTYFISMAVWFSAAYASYSMIKYAHNRDSIVLIGKYIIALCVVQGILSFAFHVYPEVYNLFSKFFYVQKATAKSGTRLFGLGTSSDTGGIRYAVSLLFIAYLMCKTRPTLKEKYLYAISFLIIVVFGNMMSRTTSVGALLAIIYIAIKTNWNRVKGGAIQPISVLLITVVLFMPLLLVFSNFFPQTAKLYEFAFEGFINFMNNGEWATSSTNILLGMWNIWPNNVKTWLIGDGMLLNPDDPSLYYMGTDVGYIRFIFYCGLLGLLLFILFFMFLYAELKKRMPWHADLFLLLLVMALAIWVKVTTDIFFVFALILCITPQKEELANQMLSEG